MGLAWHHNASKGAVYVPPASPGGAGYQAAVLALAPDGFWRMGMSSGNATDSSGNGRTLTANGSPTYSVAGWATDGGTGVTLVDAANDMFFRSDEAWMDVGTNDFSLVWVMKHAPGWPTLIENVMGHDGAGNAGQWEVHLRDNNADSLRLNLTDAVTGTLNYDISTGADMLDSGSWVHCALTFDRSALATLYVDGYSEYTVSIATSVAYDLTNARPLRLGAANTTGTDGFNGGLCEVALWCSRLLSQSEVRGLYDAR